MLRKNIIKSIFLAMMLTVMFALPVMADTTTPDISQQIASVRAEYKVVPPAGYNLTLDARIRNLMVELCIHKLMVEPNDVFIQKAKETMFPEVEGSLLVAKARQFNDIANAAINGLITDDVALLKLQMLNYF